MGSMVHLMIRSRLSQLLIKSVSLEDQSDLYPKDLLLVTSTPVLDSGEASARLAF